MQGLRALALLAFFSIVEGSSGHLYDFHHHGSPSAVPKSTDCAIRKAAYEYGQKLMPQRAGFASLFDALQLNACNQQRPKSSESRMPPWNDPIPEQDTVIVVSSTEQPIDPLKEHALLQRKLGSRKKLHSAKSLLEALKLARFLRSRPMSSNMPVTVALRGGTHYLKEVVKMFPGDSRIRIRSFPGEVAEVSGGIPLRTKWKRSKRCKSRVCWEADLTGQNVRSIPGLRLDGKRQIRARFPNFDPERDSVLGGKLMWLNGRDGWIQGKTEWLRSGNHTMNGVKGWPPKTPAKTYVVDAKDWPNVDWPMHIMTNRSIDVDTWTGEGDWGQFYIGEGGTCVDRTPPVGYWCSPKAPRHISPANHPVGIKTTKERLPNSPYDAPQGAVVHAWRTGHWYTNMMRVGGKLEGNHPTEQTLLFDRGGFQGGEGVREGENWYIENLLEELDSAREYFFDEDTLKLYYIPNASTAPTTGFVATKLKQLFSIEGSQENPVKNVSIQGLILRDAAYTYMDQHGLPSGGDWGLLKSGAITLKGTEGVTISNNFFTALDGTAVFIQDYNRDLLLAENEFEGIGESAIAAWGSTSACLNQNCSIKLPYLVGPDGRGGNQPRKVRIERNLVHEIGLWQKQSSFYFQAVTAQTTIKQNIFFNGPRAAINFNDGFGGGDLIEENLLLNACRESSDHGPFNSWDRVPYITTLRTGRPSIVPQTREIRNNFVLGTYHSQEAFDTDDGSSYYKFYNNVLAYAEAIAENGLKSDFGGHDVEYTANLFAYVGTCFNTWGFKGYNDKFQKNECIFLNGYQSTCGVDTSFHVSENTIYSRTGELKVCGMPFEQWKAKGHDRDTKLKRWPSDAELVKTIKRMLQY